MIPLGNVAISTQRETGGMGRGDEWGVPCTVHDVTPKKSWQMTWFYRSPSTTRNLCVCVSVEARVYLNVLN